MLVSGDSVASTEELPRNDRTAKPHVKLRQMAREGRRARSGATRQMALLSTQAASSLRSSSLRKFTHGFTSLTSVNFYSYFSCFGLWLDWYLLQPDGYLLQPGKIS